MALKALCDLAPYLPTFLSILPFPSSGLLLPHPIYHLEVYLPVHSAEEKSFSNLPEASYLYFGNRSGGVRWRILQFSVSTFHSPVFSLCCPLLYLVPELLRSVFFRKWTSNPISGKNVSRVRLSLSPSVTKPSNFLWFSFGFSDCSAYFPCWLLILCLHLQCSISSFYQKLFFNTTGSFWLFYALPWF